MVSHDGTTFATLPSFLAMATKMIAWLFCVSAQGRTAARGICGTARRNAAPRFIETPTSKQQRIVDSVEESEGWMKRRRRPLPVQGLRCMPPWCPDSRAGGAISLRPSRKAANSWHGRVLSGFFIGLFQSGRPRAHMIVEPQRPQ